ncbi:hypothetical protein [Mesorhizobium sp.]|uniref:hypothetical protein n=1 Tax=Mesorhizobium sp. TaxID=1871066 RepID=UPI0025ED6396|nr:hypothetical protein [Mesorhizobium sp.]
MSEMPFSIEHDLSESRVLLFGIMLVRHGMAKAAMLEVRRRRGLRAAAQQCQTGLETAA